MGSFPCDGTGAGGIILKLACDMNMERGDYFEWRLGHVKSFPALVSHNQKRLYDLGMREGAQGHSFELVIRVLFGFVSG